MQMSAKSGIRKHREEAIKVLHNKFKQLHNLGVFEPQHCGKSTCAQKTGALHAISMIKEKQCSRLKGRTVANGSIQKDIYPREEMSSPMVSTDTLLLSILIDAWEGRDMAMADVTG